MSEAKGLDNPEVCENLQTDVRYNTQFGGFVMARKNGSLQKATMREITSFAVVATKND